MKLLLNTESMRPPLTGIGNYTYHLIRELNGLGLLDEFTCFDGQRFHDAETAIQRYDRAARDYHQNDTQSASHRFTPLVRRLPLAYRMRQAIRDLRLLRQRQAHSGFIYHEPNFILKKHAGPTIATIHDLSFSHYPEFHPKERVDWMTGGLQATLNRADMLLTVSELVRRELIYDYGVNPDRVRAIHLGVDECFHPRAPSDTQETLSRHGLLHGSYLLFVGTLEPRKGVDLLLDAWRALPSSMRDEFPLVLAGSPGWKNQKMMRAITELEATAGLRWLQYVPANDLPHIYAGAAVFAYPSLYEGFGLPVLEAMASGVPVVCTAGTSMAEFAGTAPLLFERGCLDALTDALRQLLESNDLRRLRSTLGVERAGELTWRRFAENTAQAYRTIAGT
ncbi:glycosyltransferase family 4 protein [Stutzerimonas stutzeri]|jgi:alpha-1,3-rhamnosyl/mannosyltransferase|uniref:glycosyltransferase family 4 protein n=1 Tax=Stutzerimonas stutzeri TaxID=316 RepID=UPI00244BA10A|nr:glycosyltransferase family 1 protein [Stutzerimonas stutzeri]MDH0156404.1 glycosyltransferase family 4 protein [Stutzerimonas stutzeri]